MMVKALFGPEMEAAKQTCGYCDTPVYDVRYYPERQQFPHRERGGWCACCFRFDQCPGDRVLRPNEDAYAPPEAVAEFDAKHRAKRETA